MRFFTLWRSWAAVLAAAGVLAAGACGTLSSSPESGGASSAPGAAVTSSPGQAQVHNDADVSFAQNMIVHHRQAIEMASLAPSRASDARVKDLAGRIQKAQDPEINLMSQWLTSWGQPVPGEGHGGSHAGMPGMMTETDMGQLTAASGKDFDRMFLHMMIRHHQGAIEMATTEKSAGSFGPTRKLAEDIITAQSAEITEMRQLLDQLG